MPLTKKQLTLCQINDAKSQWEFYEYYKKRIMGLCRRYTKNKEEAEDVFQEVFIRVFQNIPQLNDYGRIDQWILRIAVNTAVNYYNKNKRHQHDEERNGYHQCICVFQFLLSTAVSCGRKTKSSFSADTELFFYINQNLNAPFYVKPYGVGLNLGFTYNF